MIKKITTSHGTVYLLDEENKRVKRVPATSNRMVYDGGWVDYKLAGGIVPGEVETSGEYAINSPANVGEHLYVAYGPGRDMPWSLSTEIVSIEEHEHPTTN